MSTETIKDDGEIVAEENGKEVDASVELRKSAERSERLVVHDDGPNANLFDTAKFEQCYRIAKAMAMMSILPEHMRITGSKTKGFKQLSFEAICANCFRLVNQAVRWEFDPYAIVDETYVVAGKLGFTGKLVAAVVNTRSGIDGRLSYEHSGTGDDRTVTVSGKLNGEVRTITLRLRDAKTENQIWRTDPDQKLCYSGAVKWARRHCPEVILGVLTEDDVDRIAESLPPERTIGLPSQEPELPPLHQQLRSFAECETKTDANALADLLADQYTESGQRELIEHACEERCAEISATRGQKSNGLFEKGGEQQT